MLIITHCGKQEKFYFFNVSGMYLLTVCLQMVAICPDAGLDGKI